MAYIPPLGLENSESFPPYLFCAVSRDPFLPRGLSLSPSPAFWETPARAVKPSQSTGGHATVLFVFLLVSVGRMGGGPPQEKQRKEALEQQQKERAGGCPAAGFYPQRVSRKLP